MWQSRLRDADVIVELEAPWYLEETFIIIDVDVSRVCLSRLGKVRGGAELAARLELCRGA
jgi:hypothetical protein